LIYSEIAAFNGAFSYGGTEERGPAVGLDCHTIEKMMFFRVFVNFIQPFI
jgi:hypothetical protein